MVDNDKSKKLGLADLVGISKLLDTLVEQGNLTSAERDKVAQRILRDNGFTERESALVGSGVSSQVKYRNFRQKMQSFSASIFSCNRPVVC